MPILGYVHDERGYRRVEGIIAIESALADEKAVVWIDADERGDVLTAFLVDRLKLHPLTVEDIFGTRQTPRVEEHSDLLYIVMHGVQCPGAVTDLSTVEIDIVLGRRLLFTHHDVPLPAIASVAEEVARNPRLLARGAAFVAHAIIDQLTDGYLPIVDRFEDEIDEIESTVVEKPEPAHLARIFAMKRSLQRLRRISSYQRDLVLRLSRHDFEIIPEAALPFFRDIYDHFVRVADLADSYREMVTVSLEIYMSVLANRTNDIMKVLAIISTIMLPLTFIAGVYGMNFDHMPEIKWPWGYPFALGLMGGVALLMVWYFRRKKWI